MVFHRLDAKRPKGFPMIFWPPTEQVEAIRRDEALYVKKFGEYVADHEPIVWDVLKSGKLPKGRFRVTNTETGEKIV